MKRLLNLYQLKIRIKNSAIVLRRGSLICFVNIKIKIKPSEYAVLIGHIIKNPVVSTCRCQLQLRHILVNFIAS